jgi:hypothetical protein
MGLVWNVVQQRQIADERQKTMSIEEKVKHLEDQLGKVQQDLVQLIQILETKMGEDLDHDGKIG